MSHSNGEEEELDGAASGDENNEERRQQELAEVNEALDVARRQYAERRGALLQLRDEIRRGKKRSSSTPAPAAAKKTRPFKRRGTARPEVRQGYKLALHALSKRYMSRDDIGCHTGFKRSLLSNFLGGKLYSVNMKTYEGIVKFMEYYKSQGFEEPEESESEDGLESSNDDEYEDGDGGASGGVSRRGGGGAGGGNSGGFGGGLGGGAAIAVI